MQLIDITNDNILLNYKCYLCPHEEAYPSTSPADPAPICPKCHNEMRYIGVKVRIESTATDTTPSWFKIGQRIIARFDNNDVDTIRTGTITNIIGEWVALLFDETPHVYSTNKETVLRDCTPIPEWIKVGQRVNFSGKYIGYTWSGPTEIESVNFSSKRPVLLKCLDESDATRIATKLPLTLEDTLKYCTPMVDIANPSWVKPGTWCKFTNTPVGALIRRIESIESHGSLIKFTDGSSCTADNIHTGRVVEAKLAPWQADTMLAYLLSKKKFFHDGEWMLGCSLSTNTVGGYTLYLKERGAQGTVHSIYKKYVLRDLETDDHGPCGSLTN